MAIQVEPLTGAPAPQAAPEVEPTETATPAQPPVEGTKTEGLPGPLLQIPAFQGLMSGQPPALSTPLKAFNNRPEAQIISDNKQQLMDAGIGFYRALDGETGVLFNSLYVKPDDIKAADKAGRLAQIAPPFDDVNQAVLQAGADNPVLRMGAVPGGPASAAPAVPQSASMAPPPSAETRQKVANARLAALQPGTPSSGQRPGGGRLLNAILKQPV